MNQFCFLSFFFSAVAVGQTQQTSLQLEQSASKQNSSLRTSVTAETTLNRLEVDDKKSSRIDYQKFEVSSDYSFSKKVSIGVTAANLTRVRNDYTTNNEFQSDTFTYGPQFEWAMNDSIAFNLFHREYATKTFRDNFEKEDYKLNTRRSGIAINFSQPNDLISLTYQTEARGEHDYLLGEYPQTDRDYIPPQVDLDWIRTISKSLKTDIGLRYSHYNKDVYADQYESDVPSTPTVKQIFDYLLTFRAGLTYAFFQNWDLDIKATRKAALDVNSYTGDEYVVAWKGGTSINYRPITDLKIGVGTEQSTGRKTHEVNGQSYEYASRFETYNTNVSYTF